MRHFDFLGDADRARLFHCEPERFGRCDAPELLAAALGATLYSPTTRPNLAEDIRRRAAAGAVSMVLCLEDAIPDDAVAEGERNLVAALRTLAGAHADPAHDGPLIFVRVRTPEQVPAITAALGDAAALLSGFVLPKFSELNAEAYLEALDTASRDRPGLLAMPVMESPEIIHAESRPATLAALRRILDKSRDQVLAVRIGATDISGHYGLRRSPEHTVYDIGPVAAVIADVVNVFGRAQTNGSTPAYPITGPVWEYFSSHERLFKPQLRESPFARNDERKLRAQLIAHDLDGLIREVTLDRANGLTGKSVIHPSHVAAVNALGVVSHEEYRDAIDIVGTAATGGVASSAYGNKMNESKPHSYWAARTLLRARVFGVAADDVSFVDLLGASLHQ